MVTFILGGAKSGKSSFALNMASSIDGEKAFIATAQPIDDEMKERIENHQKERSPLWKTFEESANIAPLLSTISDEYSVILVDCLTLWLSNLMFKGFNVQKEADHFISSISQCTASLFIVSNEVGFGIVPDNELSRKFRDLSGYLNREVANAADDVYLLFAGQPLKIK